MKRHYFLFRALMLVIATSVFIVGCNNVRPSKEVAKTTEALAVATPDSNVTNPLFKIAPTEYSALSEKALLLMAGFKFDEWAAMLADNVIYSFPDGDAGTRTTLNGKTAVIAWWKYWKEKSGVKSMTMSAFNHIPIDVTEQPKGGFPMGIYDIVYFNNKMVFNGKPVGIRMNFSVHFNTEKKIDHYATYYDRSVIIKAMGRNILDEAKSNK
jgi:hypothetical protein